MVRAVWLAGRGDQKRQVLARRRIEDGLQTRMQRDHKRLAGLFLLHRERTGADVLASDLDHIAPPLRGVQQQRKREARLRADWIMRLELRDLTIGPTVESVRPDR